jgi:hypothetical protein
VRLEVPRVAYEEESTLGVLVWAKMVEAPTWMGVVNVNMSPCTNGGQVNGAEPQHEDALGQVALIPETSKGPDFSPSWEATLDDATLVPGSFNIVDLGTGEPGLPGYPRVPLLPTSWGQVARGGVELTCSQVTTMSRLLKETLAMVHWDALEPTRVNP